jgi:hypothetical protein
MKQDRDTYLRRALAQQLLLLDRLEVSFGDGIRGSGYCAACALLVKVAERCNT